MRLLMLVQSSCHLAKIPSEMFAEILQQNQLQGTGLAKSKGAF